MSSCCNVFHSHLKDVAIPSGTLTFRIIALGMMTLHCSKICGILYKMHAHLSVSINHMLSIVMIDIMLSGVMLNVIIPGVI
jgi:hypothetical protein